MYQAIIFKNIANNEELKISLTPGVNLIVGPKGGGKSSFLESIAGAHINLIAKKIKNIFKFSQDNIFALDRMVLESGEERKFASMLHISDKDCKDIFDGKENIISQKDITKEDLSNTKDIDKFKKTWALAIVKEHDEYEHLYKQIAELKNAFKATKDLYTRTIYWENFSKLKSIKESANIFLKLDYTNDNLEMIIKNYMNDLDETWWKIKEGIIWSKKYNETLKNNNYLGNEIKNRFGVIYEEYMLKGNEIIANLKSQRQHLKIISLMGKIFAKQYKKLLEELKKNNFAKHGLDNLRITASNHFKNIATQLINTRKIFATIFKDPIKIKNSFSQEKDLLNYKLDGELSISDEEKIEILSSILYKSNTTSEVFKWLEQAINKGFKDNDGKETYYNAIAKIVAKNIKVYANEKQYEHMSPGEKSIFGIRYKLKKSKEDILFLDQPEDNLDNNTIAHEMLKLINDNSAKQTFIVTHNANIGILTNPQNVIIANFGDKDHPYRVGSIPGIKDDPRAYYLEGGSDYLIKRYEKVIKGAKSWQ